MQLPNEMENVACLAFLMDGAIAFAPLSFSGMFLDDSAATSSLEFSLRLFRRGSELDLGGKWWLREIGTVVGAEGRTYSEGRLFDEGGVCVASMTQQSICRPKGKKGEKL
jgi:acyl-CoA thioesterase